MNTYAMRVVLVVLGAVAWGALCGVVISNLAIALILSAIGGFAIGIVGFPWAREADDYPHRV